jgi:hypothetical protein
MRKKLLVLFLFGLFGSFTKLYSQNIFQFYNTNTKKHFYTNTTELTGQNGWVNEGIAFAVMPTGSIPIYRFYNPGTSAHYYTKNRNVFPLHFQYEGVIGYEPGSVGYTGIVYEYYKDGDYFYLKVTNPPTAGKTVPAGYVLNGPAFVVPFYNN